MVKILRVLGVNVLISVLFCVSGSLIASAQVPVGVTNGGFEMGALTGWNMTLPGSSSVMVVTDHVPYAPLWPQYNPVEGQYFLELLGDLSEPVYAKVYQTLYVGAGDLLSGWAAFDSGEEGTKYADNAYVNIYNASNNQIAQPWYDTDFGKGEEYCTPWTEWSWTANIAGSYKIEFGVANGVLDDETNPYALFDGVTQTVIPEPATMLLLGSGLLGLLGFRKKRKV